MINGEHYKCKVIDVVEHIGFIKVLLKQQTGASRERQNIERNILSTQEEKDAARVKERNAIEKKDKAETKAKEYCQSLYQGDDIEVTDEYAGLFEEVQATVKGPGEGKIPVVILRRESFVEQGSPIGERIKGEFDILMLQDSAGMFNRALLSQKVAHDGTQNLFVIKSRAKFAEGRPEIIFEDEVKKGKEQLISDFNYMLGNGLLTSEQSGKVSELVESLSKELGAISAASTAAAAAETAQAPSRRAVSPPATPTPTHVGQITRAGGLGEARAV